MADDHKTLVEQSALARAFKRLNDALDQLDRRVDAASEAQGKARVADDELQRMAADRAKLARELDTATARGDRLAQINGEVSRRLVGAMETVRGVLDEPSPDAK